MPAKNPGATVVTESALRGLVREVLDDKDMSKTVLDPFALSTQISAVASPAAPYDAPLNPNFVPQDRAEFVVAMQKAVQSVEDSDVPKLYRSIIDALEEFDIDPDTLAARAKERGEEEKNDAARNIEKDERNMKKQSELSSKKEEAFLRATIRGMLVEAAPKGKGPKTKFGHLADEEDDPEPDMGSPGYAAWEERQEERERRRAHAMRGEHEKNVMGQVPGGQVAKAIGWKGSYSGYVKGEQQLLNKFLSMLLDPSTPKSKKESLRSEYIRTQFDDFMEAMALKVASDDPDATDEFTIELLTRGHDHTYRDMLYQSDVFRDWLEMAVVEDSSDLNMDPKQTRELKKDIMNSYSSIGVGYGRLDQSPKDFKRLAGLYSTSLGSGEESPEDIDTADRAGGRKALGGKAIGKGKKEKK